MSDPREWIAAAALETAGKATEGPWKAHPSTHGLPSDGPTCIQIRSPRGVVIAETEYEQACSDDAEFIGSARTDFPKALNALQAVLDLHNPAVTHVITGECAAECCEHDDLEDCPTIPFTYCAACNELAEHANSYYAEDGMALTEWPCPTVQAIQGALDE